MECGVQRSACTMHRTPGAGKRGRLHPRPAGVQHATQGDGGRLPDAPMRQQGRRAFAAQELEMMYIASIEMVSPAERLFAHEELQPFTNLYDAEDVGLESEQMSSVRHSSVGVCCLLHIHTHKHTHTRTHTHTHTHMPHIVPAGSQQRADVQPCHAGRSRWAHAPRRVVDIARLLECRAFGHRTGSGARFGLAWPGPRGGRGVEAGGLPRGQGVLEHSLLG